MTAITASSRHRIDSFLEDFLGLFCSCLTIKHHSGRAHGFSGSIRGICLYCSDNYCMNEFTLVMTQVRAVFLR